MARVYADEVDIPQHPGRSEWTRFVCISDTHSRLPANVPEGDIFLHAGDLVLRNSDMGKFICDLQSTLDWIKSLPHEKKV